LDLEHLQKTRELPGGRGKQIAVQTVVHAEAFAFFLVFILLAEAEG
jgi:hypothetical protein